VGISGNWEKRRVETFESLGSIARRSFVRSVLTWATDLSFSGRPLSERITAAPSFSTYPFSLGRSPALRGTTVETARPGAAVSVMRFAFVSCQQFEHGYYTA
jgi:phosphodiesterase/alkaline phosphatase D-like protein